MIKMNRIISSITCIIFVLIGFLICTSIQIIAQVSNLNQRVALVIGNSNYKAGPLLNPVNDARAMARALQETNFEVLKYENVQSMSDMKRAIREFGERIQNGGVGLFYYAGHGIQVNGNNYLIPTEAEIFREEEVEYESVDVGFVLAQMESAHNRMNIIILDAGFYQRTSRYPDCLCYRTRISCLRRYGRKRIVYPGIIKTNQ